MYFMPKFFSSSVQQKGIELNELNRHLEQLNSVVIEQELDFVTLHTLLYNFQKVLALNARLFNNAPIELCEGLTLYKPKGCNTYILKQDV